MTNINAPIKHEFTFSGRVKSGKKFLAHVTVCIYQKELRKLTKIQEVATDKSGAFSIKVSTAATAFVLTAEEGKNKLVTSKVIVPLKNAHYEELVVEDASVVDDEFSLLFKAIKNFIGDKDVDSLNAIAPNDDVDYLAAQTGYKRKAVTDFILSNSLQAHSKLSAPCWYALLQQQVTGVNTDGFIDMDATATTIINSLHKLDGASLGRALTRAIELNIVAAGFRKSIGSWTKDLRGLQLQAADRAATKDKGVGVVLKAAGVKGKKMAEFYDAMVNHKKQNKAFTDELLNDRGWSKQDVVQVKTLFRLHELTQGNAALIENFSGKVKKSGAAALNELAKYSLEDWQREVAKAEIPVSVKGKTAKEKAANYALTLHRNFRENFPTAAFVGDLLRDKETAVGKKKQVQKFAQDNPEFEMMNHSVDGYVKQKYGDSPADDVKAAAEEFKKLQRVFKLTGDYEAANELLKDGVHSAQKIQKMGRSAFQKKYKNRAGMGRGRANRIYSQAQKVAAKVQAILQDLRASGDAGLLYGLSGAQPGNFPDSNTLFGRSDFCECEHCRSVYSPSAYLTDIIHFLQSRIPNSQGKTPKDVLFTRRPDLGFIELNCNNSNTAMPYVDLVCEVLEDAVAPQSVISIPAVNRNLLVPGALDNVIKSLFATAGKRFESAGTVSDKVQGKYWVIRDGDRHTYLATDAGAGSPIAVKEIPQTHLSSSDLLAEAEYVNAAAYTKLANAGMVRLPMNLPFDLFGEEVRLYLQKEGVQRWQLMEWMVKKNAGAPDSPGAPEIAAEYFQISPAELSLIAPALADLPAQVNNQFKYWGAASNAVLESPAFHIDLVLQATGISYNELQILLSLPFINVGRAIDITHTTSGCDIDKKYLAGVTAADFDRMHRFIRLWRKTDLKPWELDLLLRTANIGTGVIDQPFLIKLKSFFELRKMLPGSKVEEIAALVGDINRLDKFTKAYEAKEPSLYFQRFIDKKAIDPQDAALIAIDGSSTITAHLPALQAAVRLKRPEVETLLTAVNPRTGVVYIDNVLNISNVSALYRHAYLMKALKLKSADYVMLLSLIGYDVTNNLNNVIRFLKDLEQLRYHNITVDSLNYLLKGSTAAAIAPADRDVTSWLTAVRTGLKQISTNHAIPVLGSVEEAARLLKTLLNETGREAAITDEIIDVLSYTKSFVADFADTEIAPTLAEADFLPFQGRSVFDAGTNKLVFTGIMSTQDKTALKALVDNAHADKALYDAAIDRLYTEPRNLLNAELKLYKPKLHAVALLRLPEEVDFGTQITSDLAQQLQYDSERGELRFTGVMAAAQRDIVLALSNDPLYVTAVGALFAASNSAPSASEILLTDADADLNLNAAPVSPMPAAVLIAKYKFLLDKLSAYLVPELSNQFIIEQVAVKFHLTPSKAQLLLSSFSVAGVNPVANTFVHLLSAAFVDSTDLIQNSGAHAKHFTIYHWLNRVSIIIQKNNITFRGVNWWKVNVPSTELLNIETFLSASGAAAFDNLLNVFRVFALNKRYSSDPIQLVDIVDKLRSGAYANSAAFAVDVSLLTGWERTDVQFCVDQFNIPFVAAPALIPFSGYCLLQSWDRLLNVMNAVSSLNASAQSLLAFANPQQTIVESQAIKRILKIKYNPADYNELSKGIQDNLRERKRDTLVAYLLCQNNAANSPSGKWNSPNDLYSYYLLDVEMCSCMQTSRIIQATISIQIFVQRALMGFEPKVKPDGEKEWDQWKWMKNYRVWEANRKVFLYPENWLEPELRKDKSFMFKELENDLMQNEVTQDTAETAFLNYLEKLDNIAQLEIAAIYYDDTNDILHVFGRSPLGTPHIYYHRKWIKNRKWTPWEKMQVDITSDYLVPAIINERLHLFWPEFKEEPHDDNDSVAVGNGADGNYNVANAKKVMTITIAGTEFKNGKWQAKKVSNDSVTTGYFVKKAFVHDFVLAPVDLTWVPEIGKYFLLLAGQTMETEEGSIGKDLVSQWFEINGCKGVPEKSEIPVKLDFNIQNFSRTRRRFMKLREELSDGSLETELGLPGSVQAAILGATPGRFSITKAYQLAFFDQLLLKAIVFRNAGQASAFSRQQIKAVYLPLTMSLFLPFFYADETRTFFALPLLFHPQYKLKYYYADFVDFYKRVIDPLFNYSITAEVGGIVKGFARDGFVPQYWFKNFYHPLVCFFLKQLNTKGISGLMDRDNTQLAKGKLNFSTEYVPSANVLGTGGNNEYYPVEEVDFSADGSYSSYNWELFFHAPLMIAQRLSKNQRFEEARQWYHYIFNPLNNSAGPSPQRYWITRPFYERQAADYIQQRVSNLLLMLTGGTSSAPVPAALKQELERQVEDWRDNPFDPHTIAQFRSVAYQKNTFFKYVENLISYGDNLFRQQTMETVMQAEQMYIAADELLGNRPMVIPPKSKPQVKTFNEIEPELDAFSNALVNVENIVPPAETGAEPESLDDIVVLPWSLYFCIPVNEKMLGYWDVVADRLYKIRHCKNIDGADLELALTEAVIDPGAIMAAGGDISSAMADLNAASPLYRFNSYLQKANELCNDLKGLSGALLAAIEKKDAEALTLLRQTHEISVLEAVKEIKKKQIEDARISVQALKKSKDTAQAKFDYYNSREYMNALEAAAFGLSATSLGVEVLAESASLLAGALKTLPQFNIGASGAGGSPHVTVSYGSEQIAGIADFFSRAFSGMARIVDKTAGMVSTQGTYLRRMEDWQFQKKLAQIEIQQVEKQISAAELKVVITEKELQNHELQIANSKEVDEFMHSKYSNLELYEWMLGQISNVYFRSYKLAYALAKRCERSYRFELGISESRIIQYGYWDSLKKGLLCGEKLQADLRQLENAYMDGNAREFELTKHVSLSILNPLALIQLKENGKCYFNLPEELFDLDYAGHYFRRIKTVSLSIPCITGPYTTINCTLRLLSNRIRTTASLNGGYAMVDSDSRFIQNRINVTSIATSNAQNDSGLFEVNFKDERYLPYEGAGAISEWMLELTEDKLLRQFDYNTINDVILHVKYTAREDAGIFKEAARQNVKDFLKNAAGDTPTPQFRAFSMKRDFSAEWYNFLHPAVIGQDKVLEIMMTKERLGFMANVDTLKINSVTFIASLNSNIAVKLLFDPVFTTEDDGVNRATSDTNKFVVSMAQNSRYGNQHVASKDVSAYANQLASDPTDAATKWSIKMRYQGVDNFTSLTEDDIDDLILIVGYKI